MCNKDTILTDIIEPRMKYKATDQFEVELLKHNRDRTKLLKGTVIRPNIDVVDVSPY